jgi:hypothetical protein
MNRDNEVEAGEDRTEAGDKDSGAGRDHVRVQVVRRKRRCERPARINAPEDKRYQDKHAGCDQQVPTQQIQLRKSQVFGSDHDRDKQVAKCGRHRRNQEEKDHDDSVHGEQLVSVRCHQVRLRCQQFKSNQPRERATNQNEKRDGNQVQDAYPLVILCQ